MSALAGPSAYRKCGVDNPCPLARTASNLLAGRCPAAATRQAARAGPRSCRTACSGRRPGRAAQCWRAGLLPQVVGLRGLAVDGSRLASARARKSGSCATSPNRTAGRAAGRVTRAFCRGRATSQETTQFVSEKVVKRARFRNRSEIDRLMTAGIEPGAQLGNSAL
jgi:hypothetical protein